MSWKKTAISYLIWLVYTIMTGTALLALGVRVCRAAGMKDYLGILAAAAYVAIAGGIAFLLHRHVAGHIRFVEEKRAHLTVLGVLAALALLVVGFVLRLQGIACMEHSSSAYYEAAKVAEGQGVPQSVQGAVYFYVQVLHVVFLLLGNHASAGVWVQIVLQLAASFLLFLVMRKLAGLASALVALGFSMCAPYMVQSSLSLSPEMLFFFLGMAAMWLMTAGYGRGESCQDHVPELNPIGCLFTGILAALCCYLDVSGILLLLVALGSVFCVREKAVDTGQRALAALLCVAGGLLGFGGCILLDACLSGKTVLGVAGAWISLYRPEGFRLPVVADMTGSVTECCLLFGSMAFGIFSFWFDRERERMSFAVAGGCGIMAASCYGIFTAQMPGLFYLYVTFAVLAGIGLGQCFCAQPVEQEKEAPEKEEDSDFEILIESREEEAAAETDGKVQFLENPLPLPKKHVKRVMDYPLPSASQEDDFDYPVAEDDDYDI